MQLYALGRDESVCFIVCARGTAFVVVSLRIHRLLRAAPRGLASSRKRQRGARESERVVDRLSPEAAAQPWELPFRIISKTVGRGAYASIKKAIPLDSQTPVFAVKLIHKGYATKHGRVSAKQLAMEVSLHSHIGQHPNVIEWFASGEDPVWRWIAMEYAEGGDLFDKIEADVGILACGRADKKAPGTGKYSPDLVDLWSCGVILFVLLVGNTPWDEPSPSSWEFNEYIRTSGHSTDALWKRVPPEALSLLRGMMSLDPEKRFGFPQVRQHPWYTRPNPLLTSDGKVSDPIVLAARMLENLHIDFSQQPSASRRHAATDAMDVDSGLAAGKFSSTQPETPITDTDWDWEQPVLRSMAVPASSLPSRAADARRMFLNTLADEPSMSQFSNTPGPSMTLTQQARRFRDICPPESLTRFFSHVPPAHIVQMLSDALHQLNVPLGPISPSLHSNPVANIKVKALDGRHQSLHGEIKVDKQPLPDGTEVLDVRFVKIKGDPLEWRRFFKKVVVLCKDGVYVPDS
ncbi:Serine/threonine-protein kinase chk1 [Tolypocladium paradoxum]|uniref:Serine/threonine-protein kinase chk1 n=1 Tax=Tolypocladium paradoxum TaxID=94208 RepID=A0A2S4KQ01_9HYPO|nr:Serine/threonine-protein kinase chk1 [Tolypocladium paradoxum]